MNTAAPPTDAPQPRADLKDCVDALARGDWTEEEFLLETLDLRGPDASSAWDVLAYIDQRYRRGQLAEPIFHSIKLRIAQRVIREQENEPYEETLEMPLTRPARLVDSDIFVPVIAEPPDATVPAAAPPAPPLAGPAERRERPALEIGRTLANRYVVQGLLGRGGMGDVYKAADGMGTLHAESPACVAIKLLREKIGQRPELAAKLKREFDCARKLSHPNVIKVYEFERTDDRAFYTMELLEGEHIGELLKREHRRPLPHAYAWGLVGAVGAALAHAHARGVIHGDVSPKNVMITRRGEVRVLDFGSAMMSKGVAVPAEIAVKGAAAATPAYASCEVLEGQKVDPRDDLYSLACITYELLAGEHPFQGMRACEARDLKVRARRPPGLALAQWRTIQKGLSWTREKRPMSVRQWLTRLGLEPPPECLPPLTAPPPNSRRRRLHYALGAAIAVAGIAGLTLAWHSYRLPAPIATAQAPVEESKALKPQPSAPVAEPASLVAHPRPRESFAFQMDPPRIPQIAASDVTPPAPVPMQSAPSDSIIPRLSAAPPPRSLIKFSTDRYRVGRGAHFVETHVLRSRPSGDAGGFIWWTHDSSAKAGIDFVAQPPTPHAFAQGRQNSSLFIRLLPNPRRTQNADFHVCLGRPGVSTGPTNVTCSSVLLPGSGDRAS